MLTLLAIAVVASVVALSLVVLLAVTWEPAPSPTRSVATLLALAEGDAQERLNGPTIRVTRTVNLRVVQS